MSRLSDLFSWSDHTRAILSDVRKYIGPGLLVTLSTLMLIFPHNNEFEQ